MPYRAAFITFFAIAAVIFISARGVSAQYCIGHTAYIIRDETGKIMTVPELEKLAIKINGVQLKWYRPTPFQGTVFFQFEKVMSYQQKLRRYMAIGGELRNPLGFGIDPPAFCGKLGDLTINKGEKEMRLIFDIGEHNTHYEIDSLPFREGTFYLGSTKCSDGAPPPMIDNNTVGKCRIAADNWKSPTKDWKRQVNSNEQWASGRTLFDCRGKAADVITTHTELADIVKRYPVMNNLDYVPVVDFKTEFVLVRYVGSSRPASGYGPIVVDENEDLTTAQPRETRGTPEGGHKCQMIFDSLYRSGIRSINGKPLPPISEKDLVPLGSDPFGN